MFKMLALIAVVAAVNAQVELTSRSNDISVRRQQEVTVFDLSSSVVALEAQVAQLAGNTSPMAMGVKSIADGLNDRTADLIGTQAALSTQVLAMSDAMTTMQTNVNAQLAAAAAADAARAAADQAAAEARAAQMQADVEANMQNLTRSIDGTIDNMVAANNQAAAALNRTVATVTAALAGKADAIRKMWSGGCSGHPGSGWHWYCLNRQQYNTAAGYFVKHSHTEFRSVRSNQFINMVMFTITYGSGWNNMNYELNGRSFYYSYSHTAGCWWKDMHGNMLFAVNNGDRWRVRMHGACSHAFHQGGRITDNHSRITVTSEGPTR